jgi:hypothetical protein
MTGTNITTTVGDIERMAQHIAKSGLFGVRTPEQATALMLIAQAEGLHPAIAARDYHIINGKPALRSDAMLARFQAAGGSVLWGAYTEQKVSATFKHPAGGSVSIEWSLDMAERAQLTTRNPTWRTYPRQMLRARVISEGVRAVFPGVAVGVYTVEEMTDSAAVPAGAAVTVAEPTVADPVALVREAPDMDALKNRYRDGIKVARKQKNADMEARLTDAKDARKAELDAIPGEVVDAAAEVNP